jgi:hypothetical protein
MAPIDPKECWKRAQPDFCPTTVPQVQEFPNQETPIFDKFCLRGCTHFCRNAA